MKDKQEKRQFLKQLSNMVKGLIDFGLMEATTINEGIIEYYKTQYPDITEFNTFYGWKKEGCQVKTGAKGFLVWGKPREIERKRAKEAKEKNSELDTYDFYPIAHLFANTQVNCQLEDKQF